MCLASSSETVSVDSVAALMGVTVHFIYNVGILKISNPASFVLAVKVYHVILQHMHTHSEKNIVKISQSTCEMRRNL